MKNIAINKGIRNFATKLVEYFVLTDPQANG